MRVSSVRKKCRPGDLAPITGVYTVSHGVRHRDPHEVVIIRGEQLPHCRTCKLNVTYEIVQPISHVTHDFDFSGPYHLTAKPQGEDPTDFRMFRRAPVQFPIELRLDGSASSKVIHGYTTDLSAGGLGAVIQTEIPPRFRKEAVSIHVQAGRDTLALQARFRYQNGLRHGFEFIQVSASEREEIRRVITRRKARMARMTG